MAAHISAHTQNSRQGYRSRYPTASFAASRMLGAAGRLAAGIWFQVLHNEVRALKGECCQFLILKQLPRKL